MTISVNLHTKQEEKVLLAFLDSLQYDYQTDNVLTAEQGEEVLRRDKEFGEGETTARDWAEIRNELNGLYR